MSLNQIHNSFTYQLESFMLCCSMHEQGDLEMYSSEKLVKRQLIKDSPTVQNLVDDLWDAMNPDPDQVIGSEP